MKKYLRLINIIVFLFSFTTGFGAQPGHRLNNPLSITATPQLIVGNATGVISACEGEASVSPAIQQFTVSASGLSADVAVTAPANFEVSLAANGTYDTGIVLTQISGSVSNVVVYVRSSAQAATGNISGNVMLSSGSVSQAAKVTGHVNPLPVINPIANQIKQNGQLTDAVNFTGTAGSYVWTNDNTTIGLGPGGTGNIAQFTAINTGTVAVTANITVNPVPATYAYAPNAAANSVSLINTITNKEEQVITQGIPANSSPLRLVFSPDKSLLYVANQGSNTVSVISTATNKVLTSFPAGTYPTAMAISPDGSRLFVAGGTSSQLNIINTSTYASVKVVSTGLNPNDMAISADGKKLYIINSGANAVQFYDIAGGIFEYGLVTGTNPVSIVISPDNKTMYVANYNSHDIAVIDIAGRFVAYKIDVFTPAGNMAISPDGTRLYVSNPTTKKVTVINALTNGIITTVDVGDTPAGITVNSDGSKVYVVNSLSAYISVIDAATNTTIQPIAVQPGGSYMAIYNDNECTGQPLTFSITVEPSPTPPVTPGGIIIPNTFSPNGDGTNDLWVIQNINAYPNNTVEIFNRYGQRLFRSIGYSIPWNGTFNGKSVPTATYYYIVNLKNGNKPLSGSVTVIR
ncbi:gliding motility-associated C-terminal domain-containing protein [Mucilaginibacter sp. FT3.2]|uniref:T9SS type B sorting domain-containing protein n=1 Tax=Mucilaginibacter sp. FT3.2 TaxID=2723090 RepID=UPI00161FD392|nr:gliding motility-associated C-terminal domain-containing protein [Mucilaginibacter sp. FT3.2]MBB6231511.1 gliding motility-associated-like protein [Mucilaginibacter sp. FT3.2]